MESEKPVPQNILSKSVAVQTHFCGVLMNNGSGCLWVPKSILHCWRQEGS